MAHGINDYFFDFSRLAGNFYLQRCDVDKGREFVQGFPQQPDISLTSRCNMNPRCSMCFLDERGKDIEEDVLNELKNSIFRHSFRVKLTIDGEPTVYKKLLGVLQSINGRTAIQTNGISSVLKDGRILNELNEVHVSLDAASRETYSIFRPDLFDVVISNIKYMVEYRKTHKCLEEIRLDYILMECTKAEVFSFIELAKSLDVDSVYISYLFTSGIVLGDRSYHGSTFIYEDQVLPIGETLDIMEKCVSFCLDYGVNLVLGRPDKSGE